MKNNTLSLIIGGIAGLIYFYIGESGVPRESNATYLNPVSTDIIAWLFGAFLVDKGFYKKDNFLIFSGASIIAVHISQFAAHKVIKNRIA